MTVYFIRAGEDGPVKIGFAENVWARMSAMQTGCPSELTLVRAVEGGKETESEAHRKFSHLRGLGEWFTFSPDMLQFGNEIRLEPRAKKRMVNEITDVVDALGGRQRVSQLFNVGQTAVSNWIKRAAFPARLHLRVLRECQAAGFEYDPQPEA